MLEDCVISPYMPKKVVEVYVYPLISLQEEFKEWMVIKKVKRNAFCT
jgi:hypothetical protein